jgi:hypothetical protein
LTVWAAEGSEADIGGPFQNDSTLTDEERYACLSLNSSVLMAADLEYLSCGIAGPFVNPKWIS